MNSTTTTITTTGDTKNEVEPSLSMQKYIK